MKLSWNESKELPRYSFLSALSVKYYFLNFVSHNGAFMVILSHVLKFHILSLQDEMILKILEYLDLIALCRMNQVNKRLNNLTRDPVLYKRLNVRNIHHINDITPHKRYKYICNIFSYFIPRCKNLQQLDLTASSFLVSDFVIFLNNCGNRLTHLPLSGCPIDNIALHIISKICKNLKRMYMC